MAVITTSLTAASLGDQSAFYGTFTFDDSYPTGGEAITAATFGLTFLNFLIIQDKGGSAVLAAWDQTNSKIKAYVRTTGVEVANAVDLSATTVGVFAIGK